MTRNYASDSHLLTIHLGFSVCMFSLELFTPSVTSPSLSRQLPCTAAPSLLIQTVEGNICAIMRKQLFPVVYSMCRKQNTFLFSFFLIINDKDISSLSLFYFLYIISSIEFLFYFKSSTPPLGVSSSKSNFFSSSSPLQLSGCVYTHTHIYIQLCV